MGRQFEIRGADQLVGKLKKNAELTDVKRTVQLNGSEMQRAVKRKAPVDTSHLKGMITIGIQDNGFTAKVKSEADYAPYQEYPTRYQPGTPHVRPGFFEQRIKFIQDMKRLMK